MTQEHRMEQITEAILPEAKDQYGSEVLGLDGLFDWTPREGEKAQTLTAFRFYFTDCFSSPSWLVVCNGSDVQHLQDALEVWIEHLSEHNPGCLIQPFEQDDYLNYQGEIEGVDFGSSGEMLDSECWGVDEVRFSYARFTIGECSNCGKQKPECGMHETYGQSGHWGLFCSDECLMES